VTLSDKNLNIQRNIPGNPSIVIEKLFFNKLISNFNVHRNLQNYSSTLWDEFCENSFGCIDDIDNNHSKPSQYKGKSNTRCFFGIY